MAGVGFDIRESTTRFASSATTRQDFVDAAIFRLKVFDLHNVLQAIDGTAKIDLPHGGVGFVAILAGVNGPFTEKRCVALLAVSALFGVDPRDTEHRLLLVDPFESVEAA